MKDIECVSFLQWALPHLGMRWRGFKKVRGQVCKRVAQRVCELNLTDIHSYREYLESTPEEWKVLDSLCRVTISRFYRDRGLFDAAISGLLPDMAQHILNKGENTFRIWSAGCASGEEPYTVALITHYILSPNFPGLTFEILATDIDPVVLQRAATGRYQSSSLRELPFAFQEDAFEQEGVNYILDPSIRQYVHFAQHDIRKNPPIGSFHLILCRNLAFTYFERQI